MRSEQSITQVWVFKANIPPDKEKEEEWETFNIKRFSICLYWDKLVPMIQFRAAKNSYRFTPVGAITS